MSRFLKKYWHYFVIALLLVWGVNKNLVQFQNKLASSSPPMIGISEESVYPVADSEYSQAVPVMDASERMVVETATLSLLVDDVRQAGEKIISKAEELGGYMVSNQVHSPEGAETGTVAVRVPSEKSKEAIDYFGSISVKVVSENITGRDVTDQYVDIQSRKDTLEKTKAKFEQILEVSTDVDDILSVQREIINVQQQLDSLKGRSNYLEETSRSVKIYVNLSTDELSLPYSPSETWRPKVVFKTAVRSLISTARRVGSGLIWLGVYGAVLAPVLLVIYLLKKKKAK